MEASDGHHRSAPDRLAIYQSGAQSQLCVLRPSVSSRVGSRTGSSVGDPFGNSRAVLFADTPASNKIHAAGGIERKMLKLKPRDFAPSPPISASSTPCTPTRQPPATAPRPPEASAPETPPARLRGSLRSPALAPI